MTQAELDNAYQAMQDTWYEFIQAGQRAVSVQELECLYGLYISSVEDYNRATASSPADEAQMKPS
ncbi:hypothetical protein [Dictyobacter arantiisoli]|uniref:Uncharacterized protein n=1 Tax=Dictyobacter arantiisoli TaxID=2014874 RepID=A0A5A5T5C5_9CHLR|nr:hypothetical protein [Dictyobacter arantiisoli]GCF06507.1 hypothetical protein KDI_00710 [Dictyobacter arantiisoli]